LEKNDTTGKWEEVFAEGLSIRFAEVALRNMGNMSCKATTLYDDSHVRMIRVTALDFETSGSWDVDLTIPKTTERRTLRKGQRPLSERVNSYGDRVYIVEANDQQVATKCAAEISKASRTAILRLVPGEIQDEAFEVCKKVAADRDAKDPRAAVKRVIDAFAELGIRPPQIVQWLGHDIETGSREEFLALSKVISGLRERELVWSEVLAERLAELAERAKGKPNGAAADKSAEAKPAENGKATAADAKPQDTAKPSAAQETKPAEAAKVAEPTKPVEPAKPKASSTGKGTAALKDKLTSSTPTPAADQKPATPPPQQQPLTLVPVSTDDYEMRNCAMCGVEIEVRKTDPQGTQCEACANA
jgi:hypothetical protein